MNTTENTDGIYRQILGIKFFTGNAQAAVDIGLKGGLVVVPSAPVLLDMVANPFTRAALLNTDFAIADSGLMVLLWNQIRKDNIIRVSGLEYLKLFLETPALRAPGAVFWVMPSVESMKKNLAWLQSVGYPTTEEDCYLAPHYKSVDIQDEALLKIIEAKKPAHVIMAIGGGTQEKLAYYLRTRVSYKPGIHCTGAAIGFLSGDQVNIPGWADRYYLGWLCRCIYTPQRFIPRYWAARKLIPLLIKYQERCPVDETAVH